MGDLNGALHITATTISIISCRSKIQDSLSFWYRLIRVVPGNWQFCEAWWSWPVILNLKFIWPINGEHAHQNQTVCKFLVLCYKHASKTHRQWVVLNAPCGSDGQIFDITTMMLYKTAIRIYQISGDTDLQVWTGTSWETSTDSS